MIAGFALDFGPPEYAALALLGVLLVATIGSGHPVKAVIAAAAGLLLRHGRSRHASPAPDRFTFDSLELADGLDFVVVAMGLFGVAEILYSLEERHGKVHVPVKVGKVWPSREDLQRSPPAPIGRGSLIGFFLGRAARRRRGDGVAGGVRHGEARLQAPGTLRPRRHRGRRRPGDRQQRRRHVVVHPAADARASRPTPRWA